MKYLHRILAFGVLVFTAACSNVAFTAANFPTLFNDADINHSVAYGPLPSQKLDIYVPADAHGKQMDVVVFFYGGRWTYGDKDDYRFVGTAFANKGFIAVIPDYRKYPDVKFPVFVQDGAKALAWVYDHIQEYGGNPARIHVAGHSAGAHIGALLAANAHYLADEGKERSRVIHDFAGLSGPYDFTPDVSDLKDMFGPPKNYSKMQVPTFIDGKQPPMLLLYGAKDTAVESYNLKKLQTRIQKKGGCMKTIIYPQLDHIGIVGALSWYNPEKARVLDDLVWFFNSTGPLFDCH